MGLILTLALCALGLFALYGVRVINQTERGVKFTLGKYTGVMQPGLGWIFPIIQSVYRIDIRQRTADLCKQDVMTKDQVNLSIDGVVFYAVEEPEKVILNVENLREQLINKATSELKEIVGNRTIAESLSQRDKIAKELCEKLDDAIKDKGTEGSDKDWGIVIKAVQINNIELPKQLVRAMAKQAEAEREKLARATKAEGEFEASKKFKEASELYKGNPVALRLRELQTYQEIGTEQNTMMMVIPTDMVTAGNANWLLGMAEKSRKEKRK